MQHNTHGFEIEENEHDVVDKDYPEIKAIGNISKLWGVRNFSISKIDFNDKYHFVYQFAARKNLDQALTTQADSLSNFNRKIANNYKAGLGLRYLADYIGDTIISASFQEFYLKNKLNYAKSDDFKKIVSSKTIKDLSWFFEDYLKGNYFWKQILGGIFVTIAMVGLDQDLMQKNLSCATIGEAQKNMFTFTGIFVIINIFFLSVGALLYLYAEKNGISVPMVDGVKRTDLLFPEIAFNHLTLIPAIVFLLGLTAATFATTDSALTALTTSFCVDFLGMDKAANQNKPNIVRNRHLVHIGFSLLMFIVILIFNSLTDQSVVSMIFTVASYTYGPLLGLYAFGLFIKSKTVHDKLVPIVCIIAPLVTYWIYSNATEWFSGYVFSVEIIIINGII